MITASTDTLSPQLRAELQALGREGAAARARGRRGEHEARGEVVVGDGDLLATGGAIGGIVTADAPQRHRDLRQQFILQQREGYDGHNRRAGSNKAKAAQRIRRQRRRANARTRAQVS